ncbi:hypothetical protein [Paenibacillus sp. RS8]|uniref:hypothetical protein n=1 Tax=Paenibacillus sp. RS8 TaxID=3242681 RepID=UPI0035BF77C5
MATWRSGVSGMGNSSYVDLTSLTQIQLTAIVTDNNQPKVTKQAAMDEIENGVYIAAKGVKSAVNGLKKAVKAEEVIKTSQGIIKDFNMDFLFKEKEMHVFSADHIKNGIMDLGKSREGIMKSGFKILGKNE